MKNPKMLSRKNFYKIIGFGFFLVPIIFVIIFYVFMNNFSIRLKEKHLQVDAEISKTKWRIKNDFLINSRPSSNHKKNDGQKNFQNDFAEKNLNENSLQYRQRALAEFEKLYEQRFDSYALQFYQTRASYEEKKDFLAELILKHKEKAEEIMELETQAALNSWLFALKSKNSELKESFEQKMEKIKNSKLFGLLSFGYSMLPEKKAWHLSNLKSIAKNKHLSSSQKNFIDYLIKHFDSI